MMVGTMIFLAMISSLLIIFIHKAGSNGSFLTTFIKPIIIEPIQNDEPRVPETSNSEADKVEPLTNGTSSTGTRELFPAKPSRGKLIFVIDDAGNNLWQLEPFLHFPGPLTIAVLPGLPDSAEAARRIRAAGKEVFLHQPMESLAGQSPGPGAIFAEMEEEEIRSVINRNLDEIWPVAGMNNHQGSKITMDEKIMEIVLTICKDRGILFLDSRTTAETIVPAVALRLGTQIGERDVFLDNEPDRDSIIRYIDTGLKKAAEKGSAVMIGHTFTPELAPLLGELYASWIAQDYTLSTVSAIVKERQ